MRSKNTGTGCSTGGRNLEELPTDDVDIAPVAQWSERFLGKEEVGGSIPPWGSLSCAAIRS